MTRKTIQDNQFQFNNIRYFILSGVIIPRGKEVLLYYDENKNPIYILYQNVCYQVGMHQKLQSKKGNSKYN